MLNIGDDRSLSRPESLRVLEVCCRHAKFTRAAAELGVTPAAVSLRIRDLEAELGTKLFRRSGPKVEPTAAASVLALQISEALNLMRAAVSDCRGGAEPLRVTVVPTLAGRWLTPRLPGYHRMPDAVPVRLDVSAELRPERPSMSRCAPGGQLVRLRGDPADAGRVHADAQSGPGRHDRAVGAS